ncbi:universal stress protein [Phormidium tenue FACHB-886]|nr:universal stress protein [Phormidium tenue FACHB-886]
MLIKSMLLRLESAYGQDNLAAQMLLQPGLESFAAAKRDCQSTNLVIGYNGSPQSQIALDFALWMAHQTRLATRKQVMVHVVYVLPAKRAVSIAPIGLPSPILTLPPLCTVKPEVGQTDGAVMTLPRSTAERSAASVALLEQADQVLWQARCLADEWRGSLEAHLCFGEVATELRRVVEAQLADLLVVGCRSAKHPLVRQLSSRFPCPVLGIPLEQ